MSHTHPQPEPVPDPDATEPSEPADDEGDDGS